MSDPDDSQKGVNILCIDNGGARGLSALLLIEEVMKRVQKLEGLESTPEPHQYFDLIVGTGTGAIQACMIGRLRMPIHSAIESYANLANGTFSQVSRSNTRVDLRDPLRAMIQSAAGNMEEPMIEREPGVRCKTLVFAMSTRGGIPTSFRSYPITHDEGPNCSIWETLCATMAHPKMFKPFRVSDPLAAQSFFDAGLGCNNPIASALTEAKALYPTQTLSAILSIGPGHARTLAISGRNPSKPSQFLPGNTLVAMKDIATDSQRVAENTAAQFHSITGVYFRLNAGLGVQSVERDQWELLSEVTVRTRRYIALESVNAKIDEAAEAIQKRWLGVPLTQIVTDDLIPDAMESKSWTSVQNFPAPTYQFTGLEWEILEIKACITGANKEPVVCVVCGVGGAGKTQVVRKVIEETYDHWEEVIYIDASTQESIERLLRDVALAKEIGDTYQDALRWLESYPGSWLVVFDGADDSSLALRDYIPDSSRGTIIVTTRSLDMEIPLARGSSFVYYVSQKSPKAAIKLLTKTSGRPLNGMENGDMEWLELGYITLKIAEAGAYLRQSTGMTIAEYMSHILFRRKWAREKYAHLPFEPEEYECNVYPTLLKSYEQLGPQARELLWLIAFLHHTGISIKIFQQAATSIGSNQDAFPTTSLEQLAREKLQLFLFSFLDFKQSWDQQAFVETMNELVSHSLLEYKDSDQIYEAHVQVQDWVRTVIPYPLDLAATCARGLVVASISLNDASLKAIDHRRKLKPHVDSVLSGYSGSLEANYAPAFAAVYKDTKQWGKFIECQEQVKDASIREFGGEHPKTLRVMIDLAERYFHQERYDEAEKLTMQLLDSNKTPLGHEHPEILMAMISLAGGYCLQGQYDKAEKLTMQLLESNKTLSGHELREILRAIDRMAVVYAGHKRLAESGTLQEHTLRIRERALGAAHPETIENMRSLIRTYNDLGERDEAIAFQAQLDHTLAVNRQPQGRGIETSSEDLVIGPSEKEQDSKDAEPAQTPEAVHPHPAPIPGKMGPEDTGQLTSGSSSSSGSEQSRDNSKGARKGQDTHDRDPTSPSQQPTKPDLWSQKSKAQQGLNILYSGGVRGLSSLLLLREVMHRIHAIEGQASSGQSLKPADWFDIIAGTGTGGVTACMLGKLGMSITKAIETYTALTEAVFSNKKRTGEHMYKTEVLKTTLQSIVKGPTGNQAQKMTEDTSQLSNCKTIVFAMSKHNMNAGTPIMFRSYQATANHAPDCTIWEALYATMAHPEFFKSIEITENSLKHSFVGGELGSSNPLAHVLAEIRELYPGRHVSCIMSIGAGYARTIHIPDSTHHRAYLVQGMAMRAMAIDSERVAEDMARRFQDTTGVYFRFNVDQGIQDIETDDWEKLGNVAAHTNVYLSKNEIHRNLDEATKAVHGRKLALAVEFIDGRAQCASAPKALNSRPVPTSLFTGWAEEIQSIGSCITDGVNEQQICVIYGLGGAGKSQIALKTIELNQDSWDHIIYVNTASRDMIEDTLRDFAMAKGLGNTHTRTLQFLQGTRDRWLLVLDNADDPSFSLLDYLPRCSHGSILITTRLADLAISAKPLTSAYHISSMKPEEATSLLLKVANSRAPRGQEVKDNKKDAEALVQDFGYLALAIVHAGAYIAQSRGMTISGYHVLFLKKRKAMLDKHSTLLAKLDGYKKTVYTTWNICYELLEKHGSGNAQQLLRLIAFLHYDGITRTMFQRATIKIQSYKPALRLNEVEAAAHEYLKTYLLNFRNTEEEWVDDQFFDTISELASYSLIEYDENNLAYTINVLVQDWARTVIPEDLGHALERTTSLLSISIDADSEDDLKSRQYGSRLGQHVNKIISEKASHGGINANHAASFASVFKYTEQWRKEEELRLKVRAVRELELGAEHPATLRSIDDLAHNYKNQGQPDMAEGLYNEVLQRRRLKQGEDHADTQASKRYLASLYHTQARFNEAVPLLVDVINVQKILKGGNDPETLDCMGLLADIYYQLKQSDKAKGLRQQIIKLMTDENPEKASCMRKLAEILESEGEWAAAEELLNQSATDLDRMYGEQHREAITGRARLNEFKVRREHSIPPVSCDSCTLPTEATRLCPDSKHLSKLLAYAFKSLFLSLSIIIMAHLLPMFFGLPI